MNGFNNEAFACFSKLTHDGGRARDLYGGLVFLRKAHHYIFLRLARARSPSFIGAFDKSSIRGFGPWVSMSQSIGSAKTSPSISMCVIWIMVDTGEGTRDAIGLPLTFDNFYRLLLTGADIVSRYDDHHP